MVLSLVIKFVFLGLLIYFAVRFLTKENTKEVEKKMGIEDEKNKLRELIIQKGILKEKVKTVSETNQLLVEIEELQDQLSELENKNQE